MAKFAKVDVKQLKKFSENMKKLNAAQVQQFSEAALKEMAARLLRKVILRTPVGVYDEVSKSGKKGGTLRRGWTAKTEAEAMGGSGNGGNPVDYLNSVSVTKSGNTYTIEIINPVSYAPYVEFGHRTPNHSGWVNGRFMLTISEQELQAESPAILSNKLEKFIKEAIGK
jgi:hypothetical protein